MANDCCGLEAQVTLLCAAAHELFKFLIVVNPDCTTDTTTLRVIVFENMYCNWYPANPRLANLIHPPSKYENTRKLKYCYKLFSK